MTRCSSPTSRASRWRFACCTRRASALALPARSTRLRPLRCGRVGMSPGTTCTRCPVFLFVSRSSRLRFAADGQEARPGKDRRHHAVRLWHGRSCGPRVSGAFAGKPRTLVDQTNQPTNQRRRRPCLPSLCSSSARFLTHTFLSPALCHAALQSRMGRIQGLARLHSQGLPA